MYRVFRPRDVPERMVETATARRLAGDVAGAFAAARFDLDIDTDLVVRLCGRETADLIIDDLYHIAPDLLRWNVPRALDGPGAPVGYGLLRRYDLGRPVNLMVDRVREQPDRLKLWVQTVGPASNGSVPRGRESGMYRLPRAYWDVRYTAELRGLCGCGHDRLPFHSADGSRLDTTPAGPDPDDPVTTAEYLTLLWDEGRTGEALAAAGITLAAGEPDRWPTRPWVAVERLASEARRVLDEGGTGRTVWLECRDEGQAGADLELTFGPGDVVTARLGRVGADEPGLLTVTEYRHPIDLDLLRFGLAGPHELHPAVARALFPAGSGEAEATVAVRHPPAAPDADRRLWERAIYGDTDGVVAALDAGANPLVRDRAGRTLLHLLPHLDHERLLPRLLGAGIDVNAVDIQGHTALHAAAARRKRQENTIAGIPVTVDDLMGRMRNAGAADVCAKRAARCPAGAPPGRLKPPTAEEVDRRRAAAARGDYRSLAELAWALYVTGSDRRAVLAACVGAPLPDEFFALADRRPLPVHEADDLRCHVWRLALPADQGGPVPPAKESHHDYVDRAVHRRDPQLVPVLRLHDDHTEYGGLVLCYRLDELDRGEPTIFGTDLFDDDAGVDELGPSLLAVLHGYHSTVVERLRALARLAPDDHEVVKLPEHRAARDLARTLQPAGAPGMTRSSLAAPYTAPVPEPTLARLRGAASRDDYRSMARLAWALYVAGLTKRAVLAECYGVPFPDEFFLLTEADPDGTIGGELTNLPWNLAEPLDRGGPQLRPTSRTWKAERRILVHDPDLVPLVRLYSDTRFDHTDRKWRGVPHGDTLHCYRLSELAAGRPTVFSIPWHDNDHDPDEDLSAEPTGDSLLTVVREHLGGLHGLDAWEVRQPSNRGAGSIDDDDVQASRDRVIHVDALIRRLRS